MSQMGWTIFETAMGYSALAWSERGLKHCVLPCAERQVAEEMIVKLGAYASSCQIKGSVASQASQQIKAYFTGQAADFSRLPLDLRSLTPFRQAIYSQLRRMQAGERLSYGKLAQEAGYPLAARAVGRAMATNPLPLIIPCHRVVACSGKLGGFSADRGVWMKRWMLDREKHVDRSLTSLRRESAMGVSRGALL